MTNTDYLKDFKSCVEVIDTNDGTIGVHLGLRDALLAEIGKDVTTDSADEKKVAIKEGKERYLACLFLSGADGSRYKQLKSQLANEQLLSKDSYPKLTTP